MALSRRKKIVFALVAMTLSFVLGLLALLGADLVVHRRAEKSAGLNRYGYRGPVVGRKQAGELRVVMLGGSTVFGYGVSWNESVPANLEAKLRERLNQPVSVVNLGYNNEGAYSFLPTLEDFAYLDYDAIVLYEGYNDLPGDGGVNRSVYRRDSAVYRLTGYFPILPLYLDEKAKMLRYGGNLNLAYEAERGDVDGRTVFRPNLAQRTSAGALETVKKMTEALDSQLARVSEAPKTTLATESKFGCDAPWINYCDSVARAVQYGLAHGDAVIVGSQPRLPGKTHDVHTRQQQMLAGMMQRNFSGNPRVAWADLSQTINLEDPNQTFDAMHLSPGANATVAGALVAPVVAATASKP